MADLTRLEDIKIHINGFGPLKDITISLAPFVIITGKSNLGKSYANYLIYYLWSVLFRSRGTGIWNDIFDLKKDEDTLEISYRMLEERLDKGVQKFMRVFLGDEKMDCDVNYDFPFKEFKFHYKFIPTGIDDNTPSVIKAQQQQERCEVIINDVPFLRIGIDSREDVKFILNFKFICDIFNSQITSCFLLPPGRGAFVGENYTLKREVASSLGMYNDFFEDYDKYVLSQGKSGGFIYKSVENNILHGSLSSKDSKQYLDLKDGKEISLTAAASSIKELSPLLFYLKNHSASPGAICLEEPEAHVHPSAQLEIADIIAEMLNDGNVFNITTHSDYFLQRINQLIKLGDVKVKSEETFKSIIGKLNLPAMAYIDRNQVKAYYFERDIDGKIKVTDMPLTKDGIPYRTFYDTMRELRKDEDAINDCLYDLKEEKA